MEDRGESTAKMGTVSGTGSAGLSDPQCASSGVVPCEMATSCTAGCVVWWPEASISVQLELRALVRFPREVPCLAMSSSLVPLTLHSPDTVAS